MYQLDTPPKVERHDVSIDGNIARCSCDKWEAHGTSKELRKLGYLHLVQVMSR